MSPLSRLTKRHKYLLPLVCLMGVLALLLSLSTALIGLMPVSADFVPPDANSNTISLDLSRPNDVYHDGNTIHYFVTVGVANIHGTPPNEVRPAMETNVTTRFMPPGSTTWTVLDTGVTLNRGDEISYNATYKVLSHNTTFVSATPLANPILDYVINHADEHGGIVTAHGNVTAVSHSSTDNDTAHNDRDIDTDVIHSETPTPNTIVTITPSATKVISGGSVTFNVTEANPTSLGAVSLTSPRVELTEGLTLTLTNTTAEFVAGSDTNGNGILNPGETWAWNYINSGPITSTTQYIATGHGWFNSTDITYPAYENERALVTVNTLTPPPVPGLSLWGGVALALLLCSAMVWLLRRKLILGREI